ncbi:MAG: adenylosuccinate lyase [Verrucomicrobia bacterium RIFCSPHIGHO2_12_FULL_41_10]|nr:MAG: adenylosuccinate lyase [Verrucomicrobia bacterium RIFCSPHIGHO2_12_FULL_41_10]
MIERYSLPAMRSLWTEQRKLEIWLEIETLACEGMAELGIIPREDAKIIRNKGNFSIEAIQEIEKRTNHDVIAFLENVASYVGEPARWIHRGLTSSDLLDTTLAIQMVESIDLLLKDLTELQTAIERRAQEHKLTPMIGRSHGIHAEPITFGLKLGVMFDEFSRSIERLKQTRHRVAVGKLSGAVGTHAHLDPKVETYVCKKLGLYPSALSTQILQRDRHAEFVTTLALIGCSIDRWATEFRHLQRTEVLEAEEKFSEGQKGSSAMPHKRNPITGERLCGLARVLRGNAQAAMENVALWHERDISHSSAERIILPDSCILLDYMLHLLTKLVTGLTVYPENMSRNMEITGGLYGSQAVLLELTDRGLARKTAYEAVQRAAMRTWKEGCSFATSLREEPEIASHLSPEELEKICSPQRHFTHVDKKLETVGISLFDQ